MTTFRRVGELLAPYQGRLFLTFGLAVLACLLNVPVPLLIQNIADHAVQGSGAALVCCYLLTLAAVFVLQGALNSLNLVLTGEVGLAVVRDLRHRLYARLQSVELAYYDRVPTGAILQRLTEDVNAVQSLIGGQTVTVLTDLGTAVIVLCLLLVQSPRIFFAVVLFVPLSVIALRCLSGRIRAGSAAVRERLDAVFSQLKGKIDGILVVRASACEDAEVVEFANRIGAVHDARVRLERMSASLSNLNVTLTGMGTALVFAIAAMDALEGRLTPGAVLSIAALGALLFGPMDRLANLVSLFEQAGASVDRLGEILDGAPEPGALQRPSALGKVRGRVEFDRVSFAYRQGEPVLRDISLDVEPGMKVALVGPTGCGKTTLVHLLMRFYEPSRGEIRLDGVSLGQLALAELRSRIAIVPQEAVIFRASLADNIRYGCPTADEAQVRAAADAAGVHEFACRLSAGYETLVGEGGQKLSHGERQRVAIARALCKDPALVILDEATSSLDLVNERLIQAAIGKLLIGRTAFIIAHRLNTVIDADRIIVLKDGRVAQAGSHEELLAAAGGLYRRLCERQFGWAPSSHPEPGLSVPVGFVVS